MAKDRKYEVMFILNPELEKEEKNDLIERVSGNITDNNGVIDEKDEWGTRELAYEINDYKTGYYTVINFTGNSDVINELEYDFSILDNILRYFIVRKDN